MKNTRETVRMVVALAREERVTAKAATLAFYAFEVLVALVVLSYATLTQFGTDTVLTETLHVLTGIGGSEFQRLLRQVGSDIEGRWRAIVLAVSISTWSSLRLFRAVESVFTDIYDLRSERSLVSHLLDSLLVWIAVTVTIAVMGTAGSLFLFRTSGLVWTVLSPVLLWLSLFVVFVPLYYTFSGDGVAIVEIVPGTAVAASGWTVSAIGLRLYVGISRSVDFYGLIGAVLLVLTWLYVVGLSIVVGVLLNALLADRLEPEQEWYLFER